MRKLIVGLIVCAALAVPAPAFAIHDIFGSPAAVCAPAHSQAVGHPAIGKADLGNSNNVLPGAAGANSQGDNHCA
jgi:hypothetical protein